MPTDVWGTEPCKKHSQMVSSNVPIFIDVFIRWHPHESWTICAFRGLPGISTAGWWRWLWDKGVRHRCGDTALCTVQFEERWKVRAETTVRKRGKERGWGWSKMKEAANTSLCPTLLLIHFVDPILFAGPPCCVSSWCTDAHHPVLLSLPLLGLKA